MTQSLRLMAVLAHPDDETLGIGGTLAHYSAQGVETYVVTATRGQRGRYFDNSARPSDLEVGQAREQELRAAARELGVREVSILDYQDGALDTVNAPEAVAQIVAHIERVRPQVVLTFPHDGAYGHPDHIAISQLTGAALVAARHQVAKLYWFAWPKVIWDLYQKTFKRMVSVVDGVERQVNPWPEWLFTTLIDAREQWPTVWRAVQQHKTQMAVYQQLSGLTPEEHATLWGSQYFYRVFSQVNGGRQRESDLFAGLR